MAVGGPGRRTVDAGARRHLAPLTAAHELHVHSGSFALEGYVREPLTVRRPYGRHEREARLEDQPLILPVGVRDDELIMLLRRLAIDGNVGDAGGKGAADTENLLVDHVAYTVRRVA